MDSASSLRNRDLVSGASRLGLLSSNCDSCGAAGRSGPRLDPAAPHAPPVEEACLDGGGSGRWWFPAIRALGTFTAPLTDAELRDRLRSGLVKGGARGDQR